MNQRIPLFPLPLVVFPEQALPLHIFEPRYRQMLADVRAALRAMRHELGDGQIVIGRCQAISIDEKGVRTAAADPRRPAGPGRRQAVPKQPLCHDINAAWRVRTYGRVRGLRALPASLHTCSESVAIVRTTRRSMT